MENATDNLQKSDVKPLKSHRKGRLAWGLVITAGILLSANLYDSIQYYLGHRMTVAHLLWCYADAHGWDGFAGVAYNYSAVFILLSIFLVIPAIVIDEGIGGGTRRLGTGIVICFLIWLAGGIIPALRSATNPTFTTCIDTQRQLTLAIQLSSQDHDYRYPTDWSTLDVYLGGTKSGHYLCPLIQEPFHQPGGYGLNGRIAGQKEKDITDYSHVFLIADSIEPEMILQSRSDIATRRHRVHNGRGFAVSYVDGHAEYVPENVTLKWK